MKKTITKLVVIILISIPVILNVTCKKDNPIDSNPTDNGIYGWIVGVSIDGFGTILYTDDGGTTWERQGDTLSIPDADLNDVCIIDKNNVWIVGNNQNGYATVLTTTDGGGTWIRKGNAQTFPDKGLLGVSFTDHKNGWIVGSDGLFMKTTDGGNTWLQLGTGYSTNFAYQMVQAVDENNVWVIGIGDTIAALLHTSNGGSTWSNQGQDSLQTGSFFNGLIDFHAIDKNKAWTCGTGQVLYTFDSGNTWMNKSTPIGFYHNNGVCVINDHTVWVASDNNCIFKLTHPDSNWVKQDPPSGLPNAEYMGITAIDENTAWIVTIYNGPNGGFVLHTNDGGKNWIEQNIPVNTGFRRVSFVGAKR